MLTASTFFDLSLFSHKALLAGDLVWDGLKRLKSYLEEQHYPTLPGACRSMAPLLKTVVLFKDEVVPAEELSIRFGDATKGKLLVFQNETLLEGASVIMAGALLLGEKIRLGQGTLIEAGAMIKEPAIIGDRNEIRQGAYIRGYCLTGNSCVIGHVTEVKHSIFLDEAKAGHFAYLGDSILGNRVNLGAGTKLANLRFVNGDIQVRTEQGAKSTGLRKLGAILGDDVQTGCNSVTNPGTLLGKKSMVLPNVTAPSGCHAANSLIR